MHPPSKKLELPHSPLMWMYSCLLRLRPRCLSLWAHSHFPLSSALSALLAKAITHELNNHLAQRAELLMRRPPRANKAEGLECKQACVSVAAPPFFFLLLALLIAAVHVMLSYITGRVWRKWATGTKGKSLYISASLFYLLFVNPSLILPFFSWFNIISCVTVMSHLL